MEFFEGITMLKKPKTLCNKLLTEEHQEQKHLKKKNTQEDWPFKRKVYLEMALKMWLRKIIGKEEFPRSWSLEY